MPWISSARSLCQTADLQTTLSITCRFVSACCGGVRTPSPANSNASDSPGSWSDKRESVSWSTNQLEASYLCRSVLLFWRLGRTLVSVLSFVPSALFRSTNADGERESGSRGEHFQKFNAATLEGRDSSTAGEWENLSPL